MISASNRLRFYKIKGGEYVLLVFLIIALFVNLQPHVASSTGDSRKEALLNSFLSVTQQSKRIDLRKYWELREFHSPGAMRIDSNGFDEIESMRLLSQTKIPLIENSVKTSFLEKNTTTISSVDALVDANSIDKIVDISKLPQESILVHTKSIILYRVGASVSLAFLAPVSEMRQVNGLFNYDRNSEYFKNKTWVNLTHFR